MQQIKGNVSSIIFNNADNGYTVLELELKNGNSVTCTGTLPSVSVGEEIVVFGDYTVHSKFGEQFEVKEFNVVAPETASGIEKYIGSGILPGVGAVTAKNIVAYFGESTLEIMEKEPQRLSAVKGISVAKAKKIGEAYISVKDMRDQIIALQKYGMTLNLAMKIYSVYKAGTIKLVVENPYRLIEDVDGVGFLTADKIAKEMGVEEESEFRLCAGVSYTLRESSDKNGNTFLTEKELIEGASKVLRINPDTITEKLNAIIERMEFDLTLKRLEFNGETAYSLSRNYNAEHSIAARLIRLKNEAKINKGVVLDEKLIRHYEQINSIKLHSSQVVAIKSAVEEGVAVITGGPGTGKTTIIKCVCYIFETLGKKFECVTPTGRAAKRMEQATGRRARTIHRALEYVYKNGMHFMRNDNNPLDADVVIVDETSMVDIFVFNALLKAIKRGAGIVLVGDKDQLPSVGAGNVLADIIKSGVISVCSLSRIYRQSEDSLIVSNAHLINNCEMPVIKNKSKDFFYISAESQEEIAQSVVTLVTKRLPGFTGVAPIDIQVLCPMKAGDAGVERLNLLLQKAINPHTAYKNEIVVGRTTFRVGDKVMQTVNDYQMEWYKELSFGQLENGSGVFNGDMGFITDIDEGSVTVTFDDGRIAEYMYGDLSSIMQAYAVTVHKSQGSEFDVVIIPIISGPPNIINKNLLYTGVTRAKKTVVLVGSRSHLYYMVKNNYIVTRNTLLCPFLIDAKEKYDKYIASGSELSEEP